MKNTKENVETVKTRVLSHLQSADPLRMWTANDLRLLAGAHRKSVTDALTALIEAGAVVREDLMSKTARRVLPHYRMRREHEPIEPAETSGDGSDEIDDKTWWAEQAKRGFKKPKNNNNGARVDRAV